LTPRVVSLVRETNSLLRLFGTPRDLLSKADSDLGRLTGALAQGRQRDALHALMDCSITVFHTGDWIRATHGDHRRASSDLAASSKWLRMTRDIANAAKHCDLAWKSVDGERHGAVLAKMEYKIDQRNPATGHRIVVLATDAMSHDVLDVLRGAIAEWRAFVEAKGI
jgi:hypothetical protein